MYVSQSTNKFERPFPSFSLISQSSTPIMFAKFQKATDKVWLSVQKRANWNCRAFGRQTTSMTKKSFSPPKIQELYDLCKATFTHSASSPPHPQAVQKLSSLLDTVGPADVGLKEENPDEDRGHGLSGLDQLNRVARLAQPITYLDIFESESFTMCIFCFPTSSVIPLHDHPGMTVFSKILCGSLHLKAYDWVEPALFRESKGPVYFPVRLAKLVADEVLTAPCDTSVLYPKTGGNLHCFTAVTPCAVLDILTPPYREDAGRRSTYYHDYPYAAFANRAEIRNGNEEDYAWLAEIETPHNLYMRPGKYVGPTIQA